MRIGILGASDIAFRRFLPALQKMPGMAYAGVASRTPEKGLRFRETFGGKVYPSYDALLDDAQVDAVYVPLPPALHFPWGKKVLSAGKHLLMEKPFAVSAGEAEELFRLAEKNGLAVHENYMFLCHKQLADIKAMVKEGDLGEIRLLRMAFGFPRRAADDFRYRKALGGGALLDCGGYPVRLALEFLGDNAQIAQAQLVRPPDEEVDLFGSAVLRNENGLCAQVSFGMDNSYQCKLEIWGSRAFLVAPRIFTAGPDLAPTVSVRFSDGTENVRQMDKDDAFLHSLEAFQETAKYKTLDASILRQAVLIDDIKTKGYSCYGN